MEAVVSGSMAHPLTSAVPGPPDTPSRRPNGPWSHAPCTVVRSQRSSRLAHVSAVRAFAVIGLYAMIVLG